MKHLFEHFISLLYPQLCLACVQASAQPKAMLCPQCEYDLEKTVTNFQTATENPVIEKFWGRVEITSATALFYFTKGEKAQQLIHQLKYKNQRRVGIELGIKLGQRIKDSASFDTVDYIVPVPLHPKKERKRGYNQSDLIAEGLSQGMYREWLRSGLVRTVHSKSQTQKTREERFKNVSSVFQVGEPKNLVGKHILLVDDVLTTGATLEACASKLLELPNTKVSIAVLGYANS